jgi:hypothetical protein
MKLSNLVALVIGSMLVCGVVSASLPTDWQTNPQVAKILMSNYHPPIIVVMWFDSDTGHYQAEVGVPSSDGMAGLWSGIVSPIPTFTADGQGYFFKAAISQESGASEVYPGTPAA